MTVALHAVDVPGGIYKVCSCRPIFVRQLVEVSIVDSDYSVRLNLGKISSSPTKPSHSAVMALRQRPHQRDIK